MSKTSYEGIKAGDVLILNESGVHSHIHLDKGTEFIVSCFPPKVAKRDSTDKNKQGYIRDYFVCGDTIKEFNTTAFLKDVPERMGKITIRVNLNKVCKPLKK